MGMYTELATNLDLKVDAPKLVINTLYYMVNRNNKPEILPDHPLFETERWEMLFTSTSAYFNWEQHAKFIHDGVSYHLDTKANIKNYNREIELFWDWITPYIDGIPGEHLGHKRYEEYKYPTHVRFIEDGKIEFIPEPIEEEDEEDIKWGW